MLLSSLLKATDIMAMAVVKLSLRITTLDSLYAISFYRYSIVVVFSNWFVCIIIAFMPFIRDTTNELLDT